MADEVAVTVGGEVEAALDRIDWRFVGPGSQATCSARFAAEAVARDVAARVRTEERQRIAAMIERDAETLNAFAPGCTAELVAYLVGNIAGAQQQIQVSTVGLESGALGSSPAASQTEPADTPAAIIARWLEDEAAEFDDGDADALEVAIHTYLERRAQDMWAAAEQDGQR